MDVLTSTQVFLGVIVSTQAYLHEQHFISMWHSRLLQEIELECDKKLHLSNGKVLVMAEASSLTEFVLHIIIIMWQCMCYWEYCFKVHYFCQNFFDWLQKFVPIHTKVSLLLVEVKRLSHLSDSLKLLKVQDNKVTLSCMYLFVSNYSVYQKRRNKKLSKIKTLILVKSTSWKHIGTKNQMRQTRTKTIYFFWKK